MPTFWGGKASRAGSKLTTVPTPESSTTCGFFEALSRIVIDPLLLPRDRGSKVTLKAQLAPEATIAPQVLLLKSNWPFNETDEMAKDALPALVRVTV